MNRKTYFIKKLARFFRLTQVEHKKIYFILLFGPAASCALPFIHMVCHARILDGMLTGQLSYAVQQLWRMLSLTFLCGLITKGCWQGLEVVGAGCRDTVEQRTADKAFRLEYEEFEKKETLDQIRRVRESWQADIAKQFVRIYYFLEMGLYAATGFMFMVRLFFRMDRDNRNLFTSWYGFFVFAFFSGLMLLWGSRVSRKRGTLYEEMLKKAEKPEAMRAYYANFSHALDSAMDIRIFGMEDLIWKKCRATGDAEDEFWEYGKRISNLETAFSLLGGIGTLCTYLFIVGKAYYGVISVGEILLYVGAINTFLDSMSKCVNSYHWINSSMDYILAYDDFINRGYMHYDGTLPIEKRSDGEYELELCSVSFSYPGTEQEVLKNINLKLKVGEKLALVGKNGAGKTTLIKLLCRLYEPTEGKILLNGIDISLYDYAEYTSIFSVVFQDFGLFAFSVRDNVTIGTGGEEERIWNALEQVELAERVRQLPQGLDSLLFRDNGDGTALSGGEAQKLAIARALYKKAPFVILDEPAAALDPIAEAQVYENFDRLAEGRTAIYISHRMSSCQFCDRIVVLDQGEIAEQGTHRQLMDGRGIYARLYRAQAQYYEG